MGRVMLHLMAMEVVDSGMSGCCWCCCRPRLVFRTMLRLAVFVGFPLDTSMDSSDRDCIPGGEPLHSGTLRDERLTACRLFETFLATSADVA